MPCHETELHPLVTRLSQRRALTEPERAAILALPHRVSTLERNGFIAREGDRVTHCCLLLAGFACRHKATGDGARQMLSLHIAGDLVDLHNVLLETADHNVQALTNVRVAHIPLPALLDLADAHPNLARAMWADLVVDASILREWLLNVGRHNARQRICHLMCEVATRLHADAPHRRAQFEWPLTQEQLGDATGLTPVHVNRTLQSMRADQLIRLCAREVTVLDWQRLAEEGDFTSGYLHLRPAAPPRRSRWCDSRSVSSGTSPAARPSAGSSACP